MKPTGCNRKRVIEKFKLGSLLLCLRRKHSWIPNYLFI